ncbi:MAG: hypothetical protein ABR591_15805 [Candidatus Velthaea sp.]
MNTSVPAHTQNMAYWGQSTEPSSVSSAWMATNVTMLQADAPHTRSFKSSGGRYAMAYTDSFRVASTDPLGNLRESAYYHDASGNRIYTNGEGVTQYAVNPSDSSALSAYSTLTSQIAQSAPYDFVEADNVYFDLLGAFYSFNAQPVEVGSQSGWDAAISQMIGASTVPVIVDGFSNSDGPNNGYSGTSMFLSHPNVAGGLDNEGCIESKDTSKSENDWIFDENTLINMTNQHKIAICMSMSSRNDTNPVRNFFYASWLLSYDPTYSIAFPDIAANFNKNSYLFVYPEYQIVPTQPLQTAGSNIAELKVGSVYRREFAACYQAQVDIGPCETIVNTSQTSGADISGVTGGYVQSMSLSDGLDTYNGGQAGWSAAVPSSLGPHSAVILSKGAGSSSASTPTPTGGSTAGNLNGTLVMNDGSYLVVRGCSDGGLVNAYITSSTQIISNGLSLSPGVHVSVVGSGSCATSYQATTITLGSASATASSSGGTFTVVGVVRDYGSNWILLNTAACGYEYVDYDSSTVFSGDPLSGGKTVTATGTGTCSTRVAATSVSIQ